MRVDGPTLEHQEVSPTVTPVVPLPLTTSTTDHLQSTTPTLSGKCRSGHLGRTEVDSQGNEESWFLLTEEDIGFLSGYRVDKKNKEKTGE